MISNCKTRDNLIDIAKFIAAIFVVVLHTGVLSDTTSVLWQFDVFLRLAVPFFILCSGYYFAERCEFKDGRMIKNAYNQSVFQNFLKKQGVLYISWSVIYLFASIPNWIETGWFSFAAFVDWTLAFLTRGSYYHLWYLIFLIYATLLLYFIAQNIPVKYFPLLIVPLYLIEVVQYGYRLFLPEKIQTMMILFDRIPCISALTRVLPFLLLGTYIFYGKRKSSKLYIISFILSLVGCVAERNFLLLYGIENVSYIMGTFLTSYFLFQILINHKNIFQNRNFKILSQMSTIIYVIHPLFIMFANIIKREKIGSSFIIVLLASVASSVLIIKGHKSMRKYAGIFK